MKGFERPVRFEEIDAAGILFFARYLALCHDAMEAFFAPLPGGYHAIVNEGGRGFPAVHVGCDYEAPLRYGDVAVIDVEVAHVGTTSCKFLYTIRRKRDGVVCARAEHVCVHTDMRTMTKLPFPPELRAHLEAALAR